MVADIPIQVNSLGSIIRLLIDQEKILFTIHFEVMKILSKVGKYEYLLNTGYLVLYHTGPAPLLTV